MANTDAIGFWKIAEADPGPHRGHRSRPQRDDLRRALRAHQPDRPRAAGARAAAGRSGHHRVAQQLRAGGRSRWPRSRAASTTRRSTGISSVPRSPTSSTTARPRRSSSATASPAKPCACWPRSNVPAANRFSVGAVEGFRPFAELIAGQPTERPDDLATGAFMFYTSGTTGRPKGVRRALPAVDPDTMGEELGRLVPVVQLPSARRTTCTSRRRRCITRRSTTGRRRRCRSATRSC